MYSLIAISKFRKQILKSYIPEINSLCVIKFSKSLSAQEIVRFFNNANYLTGEIKPAKVKNRKSNFLIIFNIDRPFLMKYSKSLNLDCFRIIELIRGSQRFEIESVIYEGYKINTSSGFRNFIKIFLSFVLEEGLLYKEYFKIRRNPDLIKFKSDYKRMKYYGQRFSFSKEEIDNLESCTELTNIYKDEIIRRQILLEQSSNLSESFRWKCRGIIKNMLFNLDEIENKY
ncbi:hypothetical protein EHQ47_18465 [Leptospira bourretii]|uniref:hypothetical protein n=1 Tax=Leptospira bourretii TaxID=2484962 RepID=UPI001091672E|nr:hypothetical protein [Leptospira bourretii]TGL18020.1 hypothetical protein EHQ47_18465 [Leptospira bourretii]